MRRLLIPTFLLPTLILSACRDEEAHTRITKLQSDIEAVKYLNGILIQQAFSTVPTPLDPTSKGYAYVPSNVGKLLVSCEGAESYLDGQKLILLIGNPFAMSFSGFTMKVRYGTRPPDATKDVSESQNQRTEWEKTLKSKDVSFTETLTPGAWTKVELILSPSKPEEVAYIDFQVATNQVSLRKVTP